MLAIIIWHPVYTKTENKVWFDFRLQLPHLTKIVVLEEAQNLTYEHIREFVSGISKDLHKRGVPYDTPHKLIYYDIYFRCDNFYIVLINHCIPKCGIYLFMP